MIDEDAINVYTDGSSLNSPRKGGMGLRIIIVNEEGNEETTDIALQGFKNASNNEMELLACITGIKEALTHEKANKFKKIIVFTDSQYLVSNYKNAIFEWSVNKWRNHSGRPIANAELWKDFVKEYKKCKKRVELQWIKGHSKDIHNKAVDKAAKISAKSVLKPARKIVKVRRKKTDQSVIVGCVNLIKQKVTIRIITDEYFKLQKIYKYKYEIFSKRSKDYGFVDIAYSILLLNAGHIYYVQFNDDNKNPQIIKIYREIKK